MAILSCRGDANLDGVVDGLDFIEWNTDKFTANAEWCAGDFNADGFIDGLDFIIWNDNKFMSSSDRSAVPEPATHVIAVLAGLLGSSQGAQGDPTLGR